MQKKKVIIFSGGSFPYGSWPARTRLWVKGFQQHNIKSEIVVMFPPLPQVNHDSSEEFVKFIHKPNENEIKGFVFLYYYFLGAVKSFYYLSKQKEVDFVLFTGGNFIITFMIFYYCRIKNIKVKIEIADEIPFDKGDSLYRKAKNFNKILFDKLIVSKLDTLFVLTSYLEKKYKDLHPNLNIIRSSPSIINIKEISDNQKDDNVISNTSLENIFNSDELIIMYAGSCVRTNGLEFFFKNAKSLVDKGHKFKIVFITYLGEIQKVKDFNSSLHLNEIVYYFENILHKDILMCYSKSDILILPEHGDVIANAGFPSKTGELLASGKAICSTRFSDLTDYLHHRKNAMIAEIGDYVQYQKNLEDLIQDAGLRQKLGNNAINTAEEYFSYKNVVEIYLHN